LTGAKKHERKSGEGDGPPRNTAGGLIEIVDSGGVAAADFAGQFGLQLFHDDLQARIICANFARRLSRSLRVMAASRSTLKDSTAKEAVTVP